MPAGGLLVLRCDFGACFFWIRLILEIKLFPKDVLLMERGRCEAHPYLLINDSQTLEDKVGRVNFHAIASASKSSRIHFLERTIECELMARFDNLILPSIECSHRPTLTHHFFKIMITAPSSSPNLLNFIIFAL